MTRTIRLTLITVMLLSTIALGIIGWNAMRPVALPSIVLPSPVAKAECPYDAAPQAATREQVKQALAFIPNC